MTTIIVIVVVALVFFVTMCVISLMIWKRETEMRTDSLKAIEQNLEVMLNELSDGRQLQKRNSRQNLYETDKEEIIRQVADRSSAALRGTGRRRSADPFAWVKTQRTSDKNLKTEKEAEIPDVEKLPKELRWTVALETEEMSVAEAAAEIHTEAGDEQQSVKEVPVNPEPKEVPAQGCEAADSHETETAEPEAAEISAEQMETELCEMDEIVLPDVSEFEAHEEKEPEILSLDESFKGIENLIKSLTEDVAGYGTEAGIIAEESQQAAEDEKDDENSIDQYMEEITVGTEEQPAIKHMGYDTGRSGRKYTAEELEALIKE